MKQYHWLLILAIMLTGGLISGCGGGNSTSSDPLANAFSGQWSGGWTSAAAQQNGTLVITVAQNGVLSGNYTNTTLGLTGTLTGTITNAGVISSTLTIVGLNGAIYLNGPVTKNSSGSVTGNLTQTGAAGQGTITVNLAPLN